MITAAEREKMLAVHMCGERVVERLASIGVRRLAELCGRDPSDLMHAINLETGRTIWRPPMAIIGLQNLIDASEREGTNRPARRA
jgi:hypothetical protein